MQQLQKESAGQLRSCVLDACWALQGQATLRAFGQQDAYAARTHSFQDHMLRALWAVICADK